MITPSSFARLDRRVRALLLCVAVPAAVAFGVCLAWRTDTRPDPVTAVLGSARVPLVIINGSTSQLPAADYLSSPGGASFNGTAATAAGDIEATSMSLVLPGPATGLAALPAFITEYEPAAPSVSFLRARGTPGAPAPIDAAGQFLMQLRACPYTSTGFVCQGASHLPQVVFEVASDEPGVVGAASQATYMQWRGVPHGSASSTAFAKLDSNGNFAIAQGLDTAAVNAKLEVVSGDVGSGSGTATTAWSSSWSVFGSSANSATGAAVGIGYSDTDGQGVIASSKPGTALKPLQIYATQLGAPAVVSSGGVSGLTLTTGLVGGTTWSKGTGVPAISCGVGDLFSRTDSATAFYVCTATNTWSAYGTSNLTNGAGANVVPKSNGTNLVASSLSDNGTTVSVATENFTVTSVVSSNPQVQFSNVLAGSTAVSPTLILMAQTGTFDTTAGTNNNATVKIQALATRSAGANNLNNTALNLSATGGQGNTALQTDSGDVKLNFVSGTTRIVGVTSFDGVVKGTTGTNTFQLSGSAVGANKGAITLNGGTPGTGTATVLSGAVCSCSDSTNVLPVKCAVSSTTLTATGAAASTDVITYTCL